MPHREHTPNGNIIAFLETSRIYLGLAPIPATDLSLSAPSSSAPSQSGAPSPSRMPLGHSLRAISRSLLIATGIGTAFGGAAYAESNRGIEYNQKKLVSRPGGMASQPLEKLELKPKSR